MAWRAKNLNDAMFPLRTLCAILGYEIFQFPIGKLRVLFSLVYTIITVPLYGSALVYANKFFYEKILLTNEEKIFLIVTEFHIGIAALAQILSWYHRKRYLIASKSMMNVDETLRNLGVNFNYTRDMIMGFVLIIFWLSMAIGLNCLDLFWLYDGTISFARMSVIIATLQHPVYINIMIAIMFSLTIKIFETRFYELNELLIGSSESYLQKSQDEMTNCTLDIPIRRILRVDKNVKSLIQITRHVHLELTNISILVDKMYGIQMALEVACFFVTYTGLMYQLCYLITDPFVDRRNFQMFVTIVWSVVTIVNFLIINRCCDRLRAEAKRTGDIIRTIDESSHDSELSDEIRQFSLQIMNNDVCFSPAGLFTLGYRFFHAFIGAVVTYLVILIQMRILIP